MKRLLFILLTFTAADRTGAQQPFAPPGAVWHYQWWAAWPGEIGFEVIRYTQDTILMNRQCKMLTGTLYDFPLGGFGISNHDTISMPDIYIYQDGDTVFWLKDSIFQSLYVFNAQPGDEWIVENFPGSTYCDTISTVHADTVGTDTINGIPLKWISVHSLWGSSTGFNSRIYERLGSMEHLFPPLYLWCDSSVFVDGPMYRFQCYEDSLFPLINIWPFDCESLLFLEASNNSKVEAVELSPNPAGEFVTLHCARAQVKTVSIFDCSGRQVAEHRMEAGVHESNIFTGALDPGVYYVVVRAGDDSYSRKLIKY